MNKALQINGYDDDDCHDSRLRTFSKGSDAITSLGKTKKTTNKTTSLGCL